MGKKERYLAALDIGSAKTCALIADIENGNARFLGMGAAESKGSRKGLIVNLDAAVSSIRRALEEAESVANVPVESAVVGIAGSHVRGVNSRGGIFLWAPGRGISKKNTSGGPWMPLAPSRFPKIAKSCMCCRRIFWSITRTTSAIPSAWLGRAWK